MATVITQVATSTFTKTLTCQLLDVAKSEVYKVTEVAHNLAGNPKASLTVSFTGH